MAKDIKLIRKEINEIDGKIKQLWLERLHCSKEIAEYKKEHNLPIFDAFREKEVINENSKDIKDPLIKKHYINFLHSLMDISKDYQNELNESFKVGYCGVEGAFAHIASSNLYPNLEKKTYNNFENVFKAIIDKGIKKGVIPFENSYTGEVGEVLDLLLTYPLYIENIYSLEIKQNLIGIKGSKISDIKKIYTHSQAYNQCYDYLRDRGIEFTPFSNTALAAKHVKSKNDPSIACIASKETAQIYDLDIIAENIHSSNLNQTKFIVISDELNPNGNRFNALFTVDVGSGKLAPIMNIIAKNGFNLESIRSRAVKNLPWQYYFYIEVEASLKDKKTQKLIEELKENCQTFKVIGSYNV